MPSNASQWSRRRFLATAGATAAGTVVAGNAAASGAAASRPHNNGRIRGRINIYP